MFHTFVVCQCCSFWTSANLVITYQCEHFQIVESFLIGSENSSKPRLGSENQQHRHLICQISICNESMMNSWIRSQLRWKFWSSSIGWLRLLDHLCIIPFWVIFICRFLDLTNISLLLLLFYIIQTYINFYAIFVNYFYVIHTFDV